MGLFVLHHFFRSSWDQKESLKIKNMLFAGLFTTALDRSLTCIKKEEGSKYRSFRYTNFLFKKKQVSVLNKDSFQLKHEPIQVFHNDAVLFFE